MNNDILLLTGTAAAIGFLHTLTGPDHYLPFIVLSRARNWSRFKTLWITALCGVGHIVGSVVLGFVGIGLGVALHQLVAIESLRGEIAAWGLTAFGLVYLTWGLRRAYLNRPHTHFHQHADGAHHEHEHAHWGNDHIHIHGKAESSASLTPWVLFIIFVLGPCEPLIPLLMIPAARVSVGDVALVAAVFGGVTIATMTGVVLLADLGIRRVPLRSLERYSHALAGGALTLSGLGVALLGL